MKLYPILLLLIISNCLTAQTSKVKIPVWVTYTFEAHNKVKLKKLSNGIKKFIGYDFGSITKSGSSVFYSCSYSTLGSSYRNIISNGTEINGHHWYNIKLNLLHSSCPIETFDNDYGTGFKIFSSSYQ